MKRNALDVVYIGTDDRIVECVVQQTDIFEGKYLIKERTNDNQYIVDEADMSSTPDEAKTAYEQRKSEEFQSFADQFNSVEAIIAHFMAKYINSFSPNTNEIAAAISKSSEFLHLNMWDYMEKYLAENKKEIPDEIIE